MYRIVMGEHVDGIGVVYTDGMVDVHGIVDGDGSFEVNEFVDMVEAKTKNECL